MVWGNLCFSSNINGKRYVLLCDSNLLLRFRSSLMLCSSETSVTRYHSTWCNTSEDLNLHYIHCEDTKSHRLWLCVTRLHKVIITAVAVWVTAFRRQRLFHDYIILLPLGTDLYSAWPVIAPGYYDLQVFPAKWCQSSWYSHYRCRLLQWRNLPFWEACCIYNSFACGFFTGGLITWSWLYIEFILWCIGIPVQDLVELLHLSKCTHITTWKLLNRFSWNLVLENLRNIFELLQFYFR
jgi:hypothetical protein